MACCGTNATVAKSVGPQSKDHLFEYEGGGPWFSCLPDGEMPPRVAKDGAAGPGVKPATIMQLFKIVAETKGDKDALLVERPCPPLGPDNKAPPALPRKDWKTWTYSSYYSDVRKAAESMVSLGFQQFDSVNVWGFNAPEWFMAAASGMFAGGKCAGIYPTDTPPVAAYKIVHSGGSIVCMDDKSKLDKLVDALNADGRATRIKAFVTWAYEPQKDATVSVEGCGDVMVLSWNGLIDLALATSLTTVVNTRVEDTKPGHCAALIYTSGTTGDPKAVMISHDNLVYNANTVMASVGTSTGFGTSRTEERLLSYLPLSHIAGKTLDFIGPITVAALMPGWVTVFFARNYDLKVGTIKDRLNIAQPTVFLGVPLVWEKMADKIRAIGAASTGLKKSLGDFCKSNMLAHAKSLNIGGDPVAPGCLAPKILKKVKEGVGLAECKFALTGAAPIRTDTLEYYGSLGIFINEFYGMSESTGTTTMSTDQAHQWGSCGWEMPGSEVKVFKVSDSNLNDKTEAELAPDFSVTDDKYQGELCYRGRHIMMGYMACPDLGSDHVEAIMKKNAETIDNDGWLHSGDKAMKSKKGMIKITGRYKELIIGAGGENIAPVPIEDMIKGLCTGVAEVMMIGDKRKYNVALITLKAVGANGEVPGSDDLDAPALRVNPNVTKISQAMKDPTFIEYVRDGIKKTNATEKVCPNSSFRVGKFTIVPQNFSEEGGELTPTKKLKRAFVENKYAEMVEHLYNTDDGQAMYIEWKQ
jgi:long-chain-fatty-acid--CoA ligase ACSBG